jgi:hypothetical protein
VTPVGVLPEPAAPLPAAGVAVPAPVARTTIVPFIDEWMPQT